MSPSAGSSGDANQSPAATATNPVTSAVHAVTQDIMPGQGGGQSTGAASGTAPSASPRQSSAPPAGGALTSVSDAVAGPVSSTVSSTVAGVGTDTVNGPAHWSAGHRGRRLLLAVAALASLMGLASFWTAQGQFRGWQDPLPQDA